MDEPGKLAQVSGAKNVAFASFGDPIQHQTMLTEVIAAIDGSARRAGDTTHDSNLLHCIPQLLSMCARVRA